ncbi:hypothetical protein SAMN05216241_10374 [Limimonas halophila]|uniref:site-specific DNA-methyltransferase (adenine-specific) n=1 Tax=Limimonas halophila TaxID=1082479 RepID=A0A1G7PUH4_9PROT|nr:DNA methyltransferase [Limimonas halophila]SDF89863.1 hypothetical protein SAMN05216241_10374 [Limimonas halophila]
MAEQDAPDTDPAVEAFVAKWRDPEGSERSNYQLFIVELCELLDLPRPGPATEANERATCVFERGVTFKHPGGASTTRFIDCYKRDCFILEAKQSPRRAGQRDDADAPDMFGETPAPRSKGRRRGWDSIMRGARDQAEGYARALPVEHGYPPFLLVVDVGNVIEVFADFSGQGKNYAHFPDTQHYRIDLDDLHDPKVRERLRAIWTAPQTLDPARESAEVTQDIAKRLARIATRLEGAGHDPHAVADFLMRCVFTMFAEDVDLLPEDAFTELLAQQVETPANFPTALETFWGIMDTGGYALHLNAQLKRFNGTLFKDRTALPLDAESIGELLAAARRNWADVEPTIFGTLLERALNPRDRAQLGAHYTPRAYVERLVIPTVMEPLRADWRDVKARADELRRAGKLDAARAVLRDFLNTLATTRVLDPACGTGNFLYVAMELMKRLEGEVVTALAELDETAPRLALSGETVDPSQFLGLEVNPRAVAIADLVLWIGYLKWQLKTGGVEAIGEPVLHPHNTIREQDAVLTWTQRELRRDDHGRPITVWDGRSYTPHPVTGEPVPDTAQRVETYRYHGPQPAGWPDADFVVGNPPFIAGKDLRAELGDGYAEAVWAARPEMPRGADFVMHFWDAAATRLRAKGWRLRRFGFITTNSITQTFSRRVVERHLNAKDPLSLVFAVPDHPWLKQADRAAVRIAMTVAAKGEREGVLGRVTREADLNTDAPRVDLEREQGKVLANFTIGADLSLTRSLFANTNLASRGVSLHGRGFIVTPRKAQELGLGRVAGLDAHIRPYRNGRDLTQRPRGVMVIDLFGLRADEVRERFRAVYQHVVDHVKPERDQNRRRVYRDNWWIFGEPRSDLREILDGLPRYIATVETAKHRFFQFLDAAVRPDNMLVNIGLDDAGALSVLSSRLHVRWMLAAGGNLGVGNDPRYTKSRCFDPFPFPAFDALSPALARHLRHQGERLDRHRKAVLDANPQLTMTGLYNVLERVRALEAGADAEPLSAAEKDVYDAGLVGVLKEIHDEIDAAVLRAYGWRDLIDALVGKPGATAPSPHVTPEQEAAEQDLLGRLVALNQERAAEEARGHVRWLRPEFQRPKLAHKVPEPAEAETPETELALVAEESKPKWPSDGLAQIRAVQDILREADGPVDPETLARAFAGKLSPKRRQRVEDVLQTLVVTGSAATPPDDPARYFAIQ